MIGGSILQVLGYLPNTASLIDIYAKFCFTYSEARIIVRQATVGIVLLSIKLIQMRIVMTYSR